MQNRIHCILLILALSLFVCISTIHADERRSSFHIHKLDILSFAYQATDTSPSMHSADEDKVALNLDNLIAIAFKNNRSLEAVRQQLAQSHGQLTQARSGYLPHLSVSGRYYITEREDSAPPEEIEDEEATRVSPEVERDSILRRSANLSQLIGDFGKTRNAINVGKFNVEAEDAHLKRQMQDVIFDVKKQYYNVLEKLQLINVASETVNSFEQHLGRAKVYYKAGVRTKIDVINAEVELSNARLNLLRAEYNLKKARVNLEQVLGSQPKGGRYSLVSDTADFNTIVDSMPPVSITMDDAISKALEQRPDIFQLKKITAASRANLQRVRGEFWPEVSAYASVDDYDTDLTLLKDSWEAGVVATWELFSGLRTKGAEAEAQGRLRENRARMQDLELAVISEVTNRYLEVEENRKSVQIALQTVELARENLQLVEKRYKTGAYDVIEFNDAQLSLSRALSDMVVTYYGYLIAFAGIEYATGSAM